MDKDIIKMMEGLGYTKCKSINPFNNKEILWFKHYNNFISYMELRRILKEYKKD